MTSLAYGALWVFVFALPWERLIVLPGVSIVTRLTGSVALGLALLAVLMSGRMRRLHTIHIAALLFVMTAGIGLIGVEIRQMPAKFFTYIQLALMLWMVWELAPSRKRVIGLLTAYVLGAYLGALNTIVLYRRAAGEFARFSAGGADPNDHAMVVALGLPMAWYLGMTSHKAIMRWVGRSYIPVALLAIGLTGSRGGMLACIVALSVVPFTMLKLSPARLATVIVLLAISGALAVTFVPERLIERFASTGTEVQDLSFGGRFKLWLAGAQAFAYKPIMGYGTSGFRFAVSPMLGVYTQVAHNSFLSVLVEQGLIGFLFYSAMFISAFRELRTLPKLERRFALVLLATLIVAMLPLTWEHHKAVWFILAALTGFSWAHGTAARTTLKREPIRRPARLGSLPTGPGTYDPLAAPRWHRTT